MRRGILFALYWAGASQQAIKQVDVKDAAAIFFEREAPMPRESAHADKSTKNAPLDSLKIIWRMRLLTSLWVAATEPDSGECACMIAAHVYTSQKYKLCWEKLHLL